MGRVLNVLNYEDIIISIAYENIIILLGC